MIFTSLNLSNNVVTGCLESTDCPLVVTRRLTQFHTVELGQIPGGYTSACVCVWDDVCVCERERPNLSESERGPVGSLRTHVVLGQLHLLQSYWGGGWRGQSAGCCQLWLWPGLQPGSMGSYCGGGRTDDTVRNGSGSPSSGDQQPSETLTASCWLDNNRQQIIKVSLVGKSKMQVTMETPHSYMFRCNK